ncbi:hypothetical protein ScPMuIL_001327 [Solemya velum]
MAKTSYFLKLFIVMLLGQHEKVFSKSEKLGESRTKPNGKVDGVELETVTEAVGVTEETEVRSVSPSNSLVWGPGLETSFFMPVRYFYIRAVDQYNVSFTDSVGENVFELKLRSPSSERVRVHTQVLDRHDGVYIARFRAYASYRDVEIDVVYKGKHVAKSPYKLQGMLYHEKCYCPVAKIDKWLSVMKCPESYKQIKQDLSIFQQFDADEVGKEIVQRFSNAGSHSLCHYRVINNQIYRQTHGKHVGFKMFTDAILLSLARKVKLPDLDFFVNLGDWPLERRKVSDNPLPILSWCGSDSSRDIIMPTYDITEATLEMMGRVTLDITSVQANTGPKWEDKIEKGFWRGRDSRQERLDLVVMARKHTDLMNASLTHMFFFPKDDEKYGSLVKPISFFDFFKYKYQLNIDGTVAAYRMPYLMASDAVVLKQDSEYYEFFYKSLKPFKHYIPMKRDLSDVIQIINWAKEHDEDAKRIAKNAQEFIRENLMPKDIFCYHIKLLQEYSKLLKSKPQKPDETWDIVPQPDDRDAFCDCKRMKKKVKLTDEL